MKTFTPARCDNCRNACVYGSKFSRVVRCQHEFVETKFRKPSDPGCRFHQFETLDLPATGSFGGAHAR